MRTGVDTCYAVSESAGGGGNPLHANAAGAGTLGIYPVGGATRSRGEGFHANTGGAGTLAKHTEARSTSCT